MKIDVFDFEDPNYPIKNRSSIGFGKIEKIVEHRRLLNVEHNEGGDKDVTHGNHHYSEEYVTFFMQDLEEILNVLGIPYEFEYPKNLQQTRNTEQLECSVERDKRRQDGEQVNNCEQGKRIEQEGLPAFPFRHLVIGCHPSHQIIYDEYGDRNFVQYHK